MRKFTPTEQAQDAMHFAHEDYERIECECCGDDAYYDFYISYAFEAASPTTSEWEDYFTRDEEDVCGDLAMLFEEINSYDDVRSLTDAEILTQIIPVLESIAFLPTETMTFKGVPI